MLEAAQALERVTDRERSLNALHTINRELNKLLEVNDIKQREIVPPVWSTKEFNPLIKKRLREHIEKISSAGYQPTLCDVLELQGRVVDVMERYNFSSLNIEEYSRILRRRAA